MKRLTKRTNLKRTGVYQQGGSQIRSGSNTETGNSFLGFITNMFSEPKGLSEEEKTDLKQKSDRVKNIKNQLKTQKENKNQQAERDSNIGKSIDYKIEAENLRKQGYTTTTDEVEALINTPPYAGNYYIDDRGDVINLKTKKAVLTEEDYIIFNSVEDWKDFLNRDLKKNNPTGISEMERIKNILTSTEKSSLKKGGRLRFTKSIK